MLPEGTQRVYSYFESRPGAKWPYTQFFGLQYILKQYLEGKVVSYEDVVSSKTLMEEHFGSNKVFNEAGWLHIIESHGGMLPLHIKAVPEGMVIPVDNVMMTVENTCDECAWLTNYVESLLTHIWYSSNVATLSFHTKQMMKAALHETGSNPGALDFMLHDFGYRGATSNEAAGIGGLAHLVNFFGTDTVIAMRYAQKYYNQISAAGASVLATEHSVMTALGVDKDLEVLDMLLDKYNDGILSVVADSFDIYKFTKGVIERKDRILARNGRFVLRPDSLTAGHRRPEDLIVYLLNMLLEGFGEGQTESGYALLPDQIRLLWGDGIDYDDIKYILHALWDNGIAAENIVFGMGGGLLQKHNRDTQRSAFKCSAQLRNDEWINIKKNTFGKKSKTGRLALIHKNDSYQTVPEGDNNILQTVFLDGVITKEYSFQEVRENALLSEKVLPQTNAEFTAFM